MWFARSIHGNISTNFWTIVREWLDVEFFKLTNKLFSAWCLDFGLRLRKPRTILSAILKSECSCWILFTKTWRKWLFLVFLHFATKICKISIRNIFCLVGHFETNNNVNRLFFFRHLVSELKFKPGQKTRIFRLFFTFAALIINAQVFNMPHIQIFIKYIISKIDFCNTFLH